MELIGNPIKLGAELPEVVAPPLLGRDTDVVLAELGHDAESISRLHEQGIA
jgi:crotonobetainyl-CoA:carnitine CoA-transferase CaiB-like acyl-CoA transferase